MLASVANNAVIVARIMGGLGNQLFCYASARSIAIKLDAQLLIDDRSGFIRDRTYRRTYELDAFSIPCRKASGRERLEPFERGRRAISKVASRLRPFGDRGYVVEQGPGFDPRLLQLRQLPRRYLDGLWQDERYFSDIEVQLRQDLRFRSALVEAPPPAGTVAIHVRWFDPPSQVRSSRNVPVEYYADAIQYLNSVLRQPQYMLFSDNVPAAQLMLQEAGLRNESMLASAVTRPAAELQLMSQCAHFITANSTFSWWAAWLGKPAGGVLLMPPDVPRLSGSLVWQGAGGWAAG